MELGSIAVVGPTASGKTRRAISIAKAYDGEIISADSRQVYKGMDIGTGKDLNEYDEVPYHLIDIAEAGDKYNLFKYLHDFRVSYSDIRSRDKLPVICGGTGMYVENALNGIYLPEVPENPDLRMRLESKSLSELEEILRSYKTLHNSTDIDTVKRAVRAIEIEEYYLANPDKSNQVRKNSAKSLNALVIGIDIPREERRRKISERLRSRLEAGMVDEVKGLLKNGVSAEDLIYYGLEYKFLTLYVIGKLGYEDMVKGLEIAIHQFAKRQMTWFRGMENRGSRIHWLPYDLGEEEFLDEVSKLIKQHRDFA